MASELTVRRGNADDVEAAVDLWHTSNTARREGRPIPDEHRARVRGYLTKPDSLFVVAETTGRTIGMACAMQGLADDGAGPPLPGLCHLGLVFVHPDMWGQGIGTLVMTAVLEEIRGARYDRAQLWTHAGNPRAQRLYERFGFVRSGREKDDDLGERIVHYELRSLGEASAAS